MEHKYDVFISYSRKDTRTVDKICEAFDANGITYFIDRVGIGGGSEFPAVLANAIKSSKLFLFIGSKNSYDSKFTQSEVVFAFNKKEKGEIIPYIIDGSNLPDELDFTFSAINRRNIKDHPIETVLINDINSKLGRVQKSFNADYIKCPHCNRLHSATAMFCEYTGKRLTEVVEHKQEKAKKSSKGTISGHDYVDLGLSVKWATCNVGANKPEAYGNYYAWGETETKEEYTENNCKTIESKFLGLKIIDKRENFKDTARANWGGSWRMPTKAEMEELEDKCTWTWTSQSGVKGYKVTGPNGNSIFLPAAGYCIGSSRYYVGEYGIYRSSTPNESNTYYAYRLSFGSGGHGVGWDDRYYGRTVRPVSE